MLNPLKNFLKGEVGGGIAPDFALKDQSGKTVTLGDILMGGPVVLAFYPNDFTMVCTKQLCTYRDSMADFKDLGVQIVGISNNSTDEHEQFAEKYEFSFPLLTDPEHKVAVKYGCRSPFMMGGVSRAIVIVNRDRKVLYRYVEPTALTHRKPGQLLGLLRDLKKTGLL